MRGEGRRGWPRGRAPTSLGTRGWTRSVTAPQKEQGRSWGRAWTRPGHCHSAPHIGAVALAARGAGAGTPLKGWVVTPWVPQAASLPRPHQLCGSHPSPFARARLKTKPFLF